MFLTNEASDSLSAPLQQVLFGLADRLADDVEERTMARLEGAMEGLEEERRRVRELQESVDARLAALEEEMEERMRSREEEFSGRLRRLEAMVELLEATRLERRVEGLEASVRQVEGELMPAVEELVAQLEGALPATSLSAPEEKAVQDASAPAHIAAREPTPAPLAEGDGASAEDDAAALDASAGNLCPSSAARRS